MFKLPHTAILKYFKQFQFCPPVFLDLPRNPKQLLSYNCYTSSQHFPACPLFHFVWYCSLYTANILTAKIQLFVVVMFPMHFQCPLVRFSWGSQNHAKVFHKVANVPLISMSHLVFI